MGIEISQFRETYFEESFECLEAMEQGLLQLSGETPCAETINQIFRAAHSIKGGAGTFGLDDVGRITHVMETLLDELRSGSRSLEQRAIDTLLKSVDCVREMFVLAQSDEGTLPPNFDEVLASLEALAGLASESTEEQALAEEANQWRVSFRPGPDLMKTGNDPARIIRCLRELGVADITVDESERPPWGGFDPEECYATWSILLESGVSREDIVEVFAWVEDLAEIEVTAEPTEARPTAQTVAGPTEDVIRTPTASDAQTRSTSTAESGSIRVNIEKVDALINMIGELVITQSMLSQLGNDFSMEKLGRLQDGLAELELNTRELQESVMRVRMVPMSFAFGRIPRVVHDVAAQLGKSVELEIDGQQTEIDKTVMERIHDPLVHIVRNSIDHGLETPDDRVAAGKPAKGRVTLNAFHHGGNIVIEVTDDGRGLDLDRIQAKARERGLLADGEVLPPDRTAELIFEPGFSTAAEITSISGRGVGMDVVKRNIDALGGSISVATEAGTGTTIAIRLPLTLAILDGQTVRIGEEKYILPMNSIVEMIQLRDDDVHKLAGGGLVTRIRHDYLKIIKVGEAFGVDGATENICEGMLVVVEAGGERVGLFVDELQAQQQIVIKSLETNYKKVDGVSGATILGDGRVALILDVPGLLRISNSTNKSTQPGNSSLEPETESHVEQSS